MHDGPQELVFPTTYGRGSSSTMGGVQPRVFQRRVRFDHEELDPVRMMVRADIEELSPGLRIDVEVGARWGDANGVRERISGQWIPCIVVADNPRELVVRLAD